VGEHVENEETRNELQLAKQRERVGHPWELVFTAYADRIA
jgi:hypothetical protein